MPIDVRCYIAWSIPRNRRNKSKQTCARKGDQNHRRHPGVELDAASASLYQSV